MMNDFEKLVENLSPEIELHEDASVELLSVKSRKIYEKQYEDFYKWCNQRYEYEYTENVLLDYFSEKSQQVKASTLWSQYSMLKAMLVVRNNIDISKYSNLLTYLKRKNDGYKPLITKTLTAEQVDQFLTEAPDDEYLMIKVALILGIAGACRGDELVSLSVNDVTYLDSSILFTIKKSKNTLDRRFIVTNSEETCVNFVELCKKYMSLRRVETEHSRFFVQYRNNVCTVQPVGKNTFGKMPQKIAFYLKLPDASLYTGHCFRRTSASLLANNGVNIDFLKRLRWKSMPNGLAKLRTPVGSEPEPSTSATVNNVEVPQLEVVQNRQPFVSPPPKQKRLNASPSKDLKVYCRLCLNQTTKNQMVCLGDFHDINYPSRTVQFRRNKILQTEMYLRMIKMLMPNFDHTLVYNPIMCNECSTRLQMASDFVEQCMTTQTVIKQYKDSKRPHEKMVSCEDVVLNITPTTSDLSPPEPQSSKKRKIVQSTLVEIQQPSQVVSPNETVEMPEFIEIKIEEDLEEESENMYEVTKEDICNIKNEVDAVSESNLEVSEHASPGHSSVKDRLRVTDRESSNVEIESMDLLPSNIPVIPEFLSSLAEAAFSPPQPYPYVPI